MVEAAALRNELRKRGLVGLRQLQTRPLTDVYTARLQGSDRELFVKVLHSDIAKVQRNFRREVAFLKEVNGRPGFPALIDAQTQGRLWFHACERINRPTLDTFCRNASLLEILRSGANLVAWIRDLHALGFAHRDLSPDHVFRVAPDRVVVVDFGLCRRARAQDQAGDLQSFGLILWEMINGESIFDYRGPLLPAQIEREIKIVRSLGIPTSLKTLLLRAFVAQDEFPSAQELWKLACKACKAFEPPLVGNRSRLSMGRGE